MATLIENRVDKARRYIEFLDSHLPADADVNQLPSPATRAAILVGLRERRTTDNPLRGLPAA